MKLEITEIRKADMFAQCCKVGVDRAQRRFDELSSRPTRNGQSHTALAIAKHFLDAANAEYTKALAVYHELSAKRDEVERKSSGSMRAASAA